MKHKYFFYIILLGILCGQLSCSTKNGIIELEQETEEELEQNQEIDYSNYPEFSWDTMPLYMHVRKNTAYTDEEINYLASFPLITLEKSQAQNTYGSTEEGTLATASAIKLKNNKAKVLYYRNVVINWGNYKNDDEFISKNPSALLKNQNNELVYMPNGSTPFFDITKSFVQEYWLKSVEDMVATPNIDGTFIDANIKVLVPSFFSSKVGVNKQAEIENSYFSMMSRLKESLSNNLILANIIRVRPEFEENGLEYLGYFNGSYLEGFDSEAFGMSNAEYLVEGIEATQKAAQSGKIITMTLGLGEAIDNNTGIDDQREDVDLNDEELNKRVDYLLAIFLICAEKYSYVYLHDGYLATNSAVWLHQFDQYKKALGAPLGKAIKNGYIYTRKFENLDVWLNLETQTATLTWKE
ncbi:hypothetical protein AXE80_08865 [Wenyingzhuangia fucanilytica]|uniref:Uncharacterized protein n=1 Tax=Wenyingzhuangia fucanilytica TaxID=1790137 RepID=A0A1B1Y6G8_9FLAO|nr:putative glycoside hydrolase [Wenyingzhuangia fucanilytica]ANW96381.1 hypothetical protein AXE80_08865 [Wenyingzhuangia fucanilytica]